MALAGQAAKPAEPTSIEFGAGAWVDVDATGKAHVVEMDKLSRFKDDGKPGSIADIIRRGCGNGSNHGNFRPPPVMVLRCLAIHISVSRSKQQMMGIPE